MPPAPVLQPRDQEEVEGGDEGELLGEQEAEDFDHEAATAQQLCRCFVDLVTWLLLCTGWALWLLAQHGAGSSSM